MLYERWMAIVGQRRNECALRDLSSQRRWTFGQLAAEAESVANEAGPVAFPPAFGVGAILTVLRAWRAGQAVCPLDADQIRPHLPPPPPAIVHLKCTSATTGKPRFIAFTDDQIAADAENIVATMGLRPEWPNLGVISLAHSYGFSNLVTPLLLDGIPLILVESALPESVRRALHVEPALTLPAVPALWRAWHEAGVIPRNIRIAISAGAPLPASLERAVFDTCGVKIHNFYGASECGGIAYDASHEPREEDACVGEPMQNVHLGIGESACLRVQSQAVGEGYWPEREDTLAAGFFQTSDLVEFAAGRVFLRGRLSEMINIAGRKLAPQVVEQALCHHPLVLDCLVMRVASNDPGRGDDIAAAVVLASELEEEVLRQFLLARLPAWQVPRLWRFVKTLPVSGRGKISRAALAQSLFGN